MKEVLNLCKCKFVDRSFITSKRQSL